MQEEKQEEIQEEVQFQEEAQDQEEAQVEEAQDQEEAQVQEEHREGHRAKKQVRKEGVDPIKEELSRLEGSDEKLKYCIQMMKDALSQKGAPSFRLFWDVRKHCMELFKEEKLLPGLRAQAWIEFTELTDEARRLKELLDEQSDFMVDQINLAIDALEKEVVQLDEYVSRSELLDLPDLSHFISREPQPPFAELQKKLDILNRFASQINQMRKELIKTDMRIRKKNQFFERLSKAGDVIFPIRKDLIKELSELFMKDVENFVQTHFSGNFHLPFYALREGIKSFQSMAKLLTLNTKAFTDTRKKLSESWDIIKKMEKERKKELNERHDLFQENATKLKERIESLAQGYTAGEIASEQAQEILREIQQQMRDEELGREEVRVLKASLYAIREKINEKLDEQRQYRDAAEREKQEERQNQIDQIIQAIETTINEIASITPEALQTAIRLYHDQLKALSRKKSEEKELLRYIDPLNELLIEKREQGLLLLSDDQRQNLYNLKQVLQERHQRRLEYKQEFEESRKFAGSSGLDFVQAMEARDRLHAARERLDLIDQSIAELDEQIDEIKKGIG